MLHSPRTLVLLQGAKDGGRWGREQLGKISTALEASSENDLKIYCSAKVLLSFIGEKEFQQVEVLLWPSIDLKKKTLLMWCPPVFRGLLSSVGTPAKTPF